MCILLPGTALATNCCNALSLCRARDALKSFEIRPETSEPLLSLPAAAPPKRANFKYDYVFAAFKAFLFFEVQRGGTQAADTRVWRASDASALDAAMVQGQAKSLDGGWWEAGSALLSFHCTRACSTFAGSVELIGRLVPVCTVYVRGVVVHDCKRIC